VVTDILFARLVGLREKSGMSFSIRFAPWTTSGWYVALVVWHPAHSAARSAFYRRCSRSEALLPYRHRDYEDQAREIEVWFFEDRMEVKSPGDLVPPVTLDLLRSRTAVHAIRGWASHHETPGMSQ
jgi:hypothetical protein